MEGCQLAKLRVIDKPKIITYPLGGGYVLFYTLFLTAPAPSLSGITRLTVSVSLSLSHFIPSFWNNSATVRETV